MNRSRSVLFVLLLPLWLAGCADERAAGRTPTPAPYPLAPYGVPLATGPAAPLG